MSRGADGVSIIERERLGADDLVGFMAFSGNQDGIVRRGCQAACEADGFCTIRFDMAGCSGGDSGQDLANDLIGIFRAWIVGCHDKRVGEPCGGFAHARAFGPIAVTAGSEQDEKASLCDFAKCPADVFDGVRGMGIIDEEGGGGIGSMDRFESAAHGRCRFEDIGQSGRFDFGGGGNGGEGGGEIQCVMPSEQMRTDGACGDEGIFANGDFERRSIGGEPEVVNPEIGGIAEAVGTAERLRRKGTAVGGEALSKRVIGLNDGAGRRCGGGGGVGNEEASFCGEVGFERMVVIEVILRQVCENGCGKARTIGTMLRERVGRDLDCGCSAAVVEH